MKGKYTTSGVSDGSNGPPYTAGSMEPSLGPVLFSFPQKNFIHPIESLDTEH